MIKRVLTVFMRYLHPRSAVSFWHTPIRGVEYDYSTLDDYYIDFSAKPCYLGPYDERGIPLLDYLGDVGRQYNPCAISQWGLGAYQRWRRGEPEQGDIFWRAADWLVDNLAVDVRGRGYWWYEFDFDAYGLRAPWASALAQAQGISLLLRAYESNRNIKYLQCANQACAAMLSPVADGGLLLVKDGHYFLEEVVADRPTAILDGLIFAIFGLRDYCLINKSDLEACAVLDGCIETIAMLLPEYDLGYWSRADLYAENPPMPASSFYHGLHVAQLDILYRLTENPVFKKYSAMWGRVARSPINRTRAFFSKVIFKLAHY